MDEGTPLRVVQSTAGEGLGFESEALMNEVRLRQHALQVQAEGYGYQSALSSLGMRWGPLTTAATGAGQAFSIWNSFPDEDK